jgi:ankyrin repeat protein
MNRRESSRMSAELMKAVMDGELERCRELLAQGADVNARSPLGTPVQRAAAEGHREILELLLGANPDLDQGNSLATPLSAALGAGHQEVALRLIEVGADPEQAPGHGGDPPIFEAVKQNLPEVVGALLEAGANPDPVSRQIAFGDPLAALGGMAGFEELFKGLEMPDLGDSGEVLKRATPLHLAAVLGHGEVVRSLLEAGADSGRRDGEGRTVFDLAQGEVLSVLNSCGHSPPGATAGELLLLAAESGDPEQVSLHLADGADIETRDSRADYQEMTPLMLASRKGHLEVVRLLLQAGAKLDASDEQQKIPSMLVSEMGETELLQMGYTLHRSSLMWAICNRHHQVALLLLEHGSAHDRKDNLGMTPLLLAAQAGSRPVAEALVAGGVKADQTGRSKLTALMLACGEGHLGLVDWLVGLKQKLDRKDGQGDTAMIHACRNGHFRVVSRLIKAGCKADLTARDGTSPLEALLGARNEVPMSEADGIGEAQIFNERGHFTLAPLPEKDLLPIVEELLKAGADPNSNKGFATPLGAAARNEHLQVIERLIQAGANPDRGSRDGDSAIDMAKLFNKQKALKVLQSHSRGGSENKRRRNPVKEPDRWGPEVAQPDFSSAMNEPKFREALEELGERCHGNVTEQEGYATIHVKTSVRDSLSVEELQSEYSKRGAYLFLRDSQSTLAAIPTTRWQDALALMQTNGVNCGIGPGYVIEWMEDLMKSHPFQLTTVAHNILAGHFRDEVKDPDDLAQRMYDFCPDIVDQGTGTVKELADTLRESRSFFFWWD